MKEIVIKYVVFVVLLLLIGFCPVWLVMILAGIAALVFDNFFEIIAIGLIYDIRFHVPGAPWYLLGLHTIIVIAIFVVTVVIHKITRKPKLLAL